MLETECDPMHENSPALLLTLSGAGSALETLIKLNILILIALIIYYLFQIGNKQVDEKKKLREAPEYLEIRGEVYMKNAAFEHHLQMSLEEMSLQTQYYEVKYGDFDVKIRHC